MENKLNIQNVLASVQPFMYEKNEKNSRLEAFTQTAERASWRKEEEGVCRSPFLMFIPQVEHLLIRRINSL
jgi:hypothetical protein